jgi:recombination protein RecA
MAKAQPVAKLHPKLARFMAGMEKKSGIDMQDIVVTPSLKMEHINTGSTVLNMLIGGSRVGDGSFLCPGYPRGKIIEIYGRESSGKSTIALMAAGQAVASNGGTGSVLYVDLEHAVVDAYALKLGVDFRPIELGGNGQAIRVAPHIFEETEALVNGAALNGVDLIVVDSVAGLVSRREASRDLTNEKEKQGVAEIPRLMSAWMPKLQAIIAKTGTTVIFLNQTRDKIGAMGYTEEALKSTTGGNALKFWASLRMMLKPKQSAKAKVFNPIIKEYEEVPVATDVEVKNIKNKIDARQGHTGLITIRYGVGIDEMRTMLNVAEAYNIVKMSKNARKQEVYTYKCAATGDVIEAIGVEKFRVAMQRNSTAFEEMMSACRDRIIQGFRAIDDEQLAQLAEDAVTKKIDDEDEYLDDSSTALVSPNDMGLDDSEEDSDSNVTISADDV